MKILDVNIGDGHQYQVRVNDQGFIVATACKGRWPMSTASTGNDWLDSRLQREVNSMQEQVEPVAR